MCFQPHSFAVLLNLRVGAETSLINGDLGAVLATLVQAEVGSDSVFRGRRIECKIAMCKV
jgi:hypothetical protein